MALDSDSHYTWVTWPDGPTGPWKITTPNGKTATGKGGIEITYKRRLCDLRLMELQSVARDLNVPGRSRLARAPLAALIEQHIRNG